MPQTIPHIVRNLLGINRRDGADKVLDNEFTTLQNWVHLSKGLIYKRSGSSEELSRAEFYGASRITAMERYYDPYGEAHTLYHCEPNTRRLLPQPTADLILTEDDGGDIYNGAGVTALRLCYTWVGMGMESNYNSSQRAGYTAINSPANIPLDAWSQPGHQTFTPSANTKKVVITAPSSFPKGVRGMNIFGARGTSTQMTYLGSITTPGGTLDWKEFIGPAAAYGDAITANNVTLEGANSASGNLPPGNYYVGLAWFINPNVKDGAAPGVPATGMHPVTLDYSELVTIDGNQNAIQLNVNDAPSSNGAEALYVFLSTKPFDEAPMMCAGIIRGDGSEDFVINDWPKNHNASTHPWGEGAFFNNAVLANDSHNTNRYGMMLKKDPNDDVNEIFFSRSIWMGPWAASAGSLPVGPVDPEFANASPAAYLQNIYTPANNVASHTSIPHLALYEGYAPFFATIDPLPDGAFQLLAPNRNYLEPTFAAIQGLLYMTNGSNYISTCDGFALGFINYSNGNATIKAFPPMPNLITVFDNSLIVAGAECRNQIFHTNALAPLNFAVGATGDAVRFATIGDPFGAGVTMLGRYSYTTGVEGPESFLLAIKKSSTWTLSALPDSQAGSFNNISGRIGGTAYRSLIHTSRGTMFIGNDGGIYLVRGVGEPVPVGNKVKPLLKHLGADDALMKKVTACFHDDFYKISYPSAADSTNNDAQLYADMDTSAEDPITWSGPHIGINIGPQITYDGDGDDRTRHGAYADDISPLLLDDPSTFQDAGNAIVSLIESKEYRFQSEINRKRFMWMILDAYYDSVFDHSMILQAFADDEMIYIDKELSSGGSQWNIDNWDEANWTGARFTEVSMPFPENLIGRTFKYSLTHSDNAQIILASMTTLFKPERRIVL